MNEPNYYAVIPAPIMFDNKLPPNAKLLYGLISSLTNKSGYCWASNDYLAQLFSVNKFSVSGWVSNLEKAGYIRTELVYKDKTREVMQRKIYILPIGIEKNANIPIENIDNNITKEDITKEDISLAQPEQTPASNIVNFQAAAKPKQKTLAQLVEEFTQDVNLKSELSRYLAMRKQLKQYPTIIAFEDSLKELKKLGGVPIQIKSVQQSIRSEYRSFYSLGFSGNGQSGFDNTSQHVTEKSYKNMTPEEREAYEIGGLAKNDDGSPMNF